MTKNQITRMVYAFAVGWLSVDAYGGWGIPIGVLITITAITTGEIFGDNS